MILGQTATCLLNAAASAAALLFGVIWSAATCCRFSVRFVVDRTATSVPALRKKTQLHFDGSYAKLFQPLSLLDATLVGSSYVLQTKDLRDT